MKAEAPEKIYLSAIDLEEVGYLLTESNDRYDVEYTRTDAFIEKAKSWFIQQHTGMWNEFKNYMKGE